MRKLAIYAGCLLVIAGSWPGYQLYREISKARSEDPLVWEADITALETATAPAPANTMVVFVGSSSIRLWDSLAADMQPIPVVQQGFGGAKLNDVVHFAERLVSNYQPRAVVIFAGTNDIDPRAAKAPATLLHSYQQLVQQLQAPQPELQIYFIAITPSLMRWEVWPVAAETNRLIAKFSEGEPHLHIIDTGAALLGEDGLPNRENYRFDGLHLSAEGYAIWTDIIRSRLLEDMPDLATASR